MILKKSSNNDLEVLATKNGPWAFYKTKTAANNDLANIPEGSIVAIEEASSTAIDSLPVGTWASFENTDSAPNSQWIKAGTTFDEDDYPELYLYLGTNVVPERYDHSRLGEIESITIKTVNHGVIPLENERTIMPYDGFLFMKGTGYESSYNELFINSTSVPFVVRDETDTYGNDFCVFPVKKGDVVYSSKGSRSGNNNTFWIRYYTHPMFIKAKSFVEESVPNAAIETVKDYTKSYVNAKNSYSTEETSTGGTWIDGKPIYRKVIQVGTFTTSSPLCVTIPNLDTFIDIKFKRNYDSSHPTWWVIGDGTASANNLYIKQALSTDTIIIEPVSNNITIKNFTGIIEYTKTTD